MNRRINNKLRKVNMEEVSKEQKGQNAFLP